MAHRLSDGTPTTAYRGTTRTRGDAAELGCCPLPGPARRRRRVPLALCGVLLLFAAVQTGCAVNADMQQMNADLKHPNASGQQSEAAAIYTADFRVIMYCFLCMPAYIERQSADFAEVYHNPTVGMIVESVVADGQRIEAVRDHTNYYSFDMTTVALPDPLHDYQVLAPCDCQTNCFKLLSVSDITDNDIVLRAFHIPLESKKLEIEYRVRYPVGEPGPLTRLIATYSHASP